MSHTKLSPLEGTDISLKSLSCGSTLHLGLDWQVITILSHLQVTPHYRVFVLTDVCDLKSLELGIFVASWVIIMLFAHLS